MSAIKIRKKDSRHKNSRKTKSVIRKKTNRAFEKAWEFWQKAQIDLSNFKFDREEANAR